MRQATAKELIAALQELRTHTLSAFQAYERANRLHIPYQPELNPPLWELGHVAWFQEYWIARNVQRSEGVAMPLGLAKKESLLVNADQWYDSAKVQHDTRWDQAITSRDLCLAYAAQTLEQTVKLLQSEAEDSPALYFYWLALQHEAMHLEASAYMAQALTIPFELVWVNAHANSTARKATGQTAHAPGSSLTTARVPSQSWTLGSAPSQFCFDNELMARPVALNAFEIDLAPVCWSHYMSFIAATGHRMPPYVRSAGSSFEVQTFGAWCPINMQAPAVHLSWDDALTYCAWAKRRLPTEAEWDCAARTLPNFDWGDVWEWSQDTFEPFEGFMVHPYAEYSAPWFGTRKVLRGAAAVTHSVLRNIQYRNFFTPERHDIYSGFRTCSPSG